MKRTSDTSSSTTDRSFVSSWYINQVIKNKEQTMPAWENDDNVYVVKELQLYLKKYNRTAMFPAKTLRREFSCGAGLL